MPEQDDRRTDGAPPRDIRGEKKVNWLAWIMLALGVLAALLALSRCRRHDDAATTAVTTANSTEIVSGPPGTPSSADPAGISSLGGYLGGRESAPRTFAFEKVNFDTAQSAIRSADQPEVDAVAATLKTYPSAHIRIAGYADMRGSSAANAALGKARADSVKAALVAEGIAADRIETISGGEASPVDTNATAGGRAQNRRTELVVTQR